MPPRSTTTPSDFRQFRARTVDEACAMYSDFGQKVTVRGVPIREPFTSTITVAQLAHTTASLARLAGISTRTLQEAFRQQLGHTPMGYLRQVRLARARDDLTTAAHSTVAEIAYRWGFTHLGRFAAAYRAKYGVARSTTLRGPQK